MQASDIKKLLTSGQAAEMMGVTTRTIKRWSDEGRLTVAWTTPGRHRRFERSEIERFMQAAQINADRMEEVESALTTADEAQRGDVIR